MNILITTLSLIKLRNFSCQSYVCEDGNPETGWFTNEAPGRYLIRRLYDTAYTLFDRIILLASKECVNNRFTTEQLEKALEENTHLSAEEKEKRRAYFREKLEGRTTVEYYMDVMTALMREQDPDRYALMFGGERKNTLPGHAAGMAEAPEDLLQIINVDEPFSQDLIDRVLHTADNPFEAGVFMDYTGGNRVQAFIGMMVLRCLDEAGFRVHTVAYSDINSRPFRVRDITGDYRMMDGVIATARLQEEKRREEGKGSLREDAKLTASRQKMVVDYQSFGGREEDIKDYARPSRTDRPFFFLSYAHRDMLFAQTLIKHMQQAGIRIWYDEGIKPSADWERTLRQKIRECRGFLYLVSDNYWASPNCINEIEWADASAQETPGGKIFVHVFLGDGKVPEDIRKKDASWEKDQGIMWKKYRTMDALVRKILETEYIEEMMENDGRLY